MPLGRATFLSLLATALASCTPASEQVAFETTVSLPTDADAVDADLRDFLVPAEPDSDLCRLLEPGSADRELAKAVADGRLKVMIVEVGLNFLKFAGEPLAAPDGRTNTVVEDGVFSREVLRGGQLKPLAEQARSFTAMGGEQRCRQGPGVLLALDPGISKEAAQAATHTAAMAGLIPPVFLVERSPGSVGPSPGADTEESRDPPARAWMVGAPLTVRKTRPRPTIGDARPAEGDHRAD